MVKLLLEMKQIGKQFDYRMDDIVDYFSRNPSLLDYNSKAYLQFKGERPDTTINWNKLVS